MLLVAHLTDEKMKLPEGLARGRSRLAGQMQEEMFSEAGLASRAVAAGGRGGVAWDPLRPGGNQEQNLVSTYLGSLCAMYYKCVCVAGSMCGGLTMSETRAPNKQSYGVWGGGQGGQGHSGAQVRSWLNLGSGSTFSSSCDHIFNMLRVGSRG